MKQFVLHLLVMSHSYSVPSLKRVCIYVLEQGWLTKENVIDVLQLARNCDAPRLSLICIRIIVGDFKTISSTEAWKVMKLSSPELEQELLECVVEADSVSQFLFFVQTSLFYFCLLFKKTCQGCIKTYIRHEEGTETLYLINLISELCFFTY